jgi:iron complex transport system substrate-binding protein
MAAVKSGAIVPVNDTIVTRPGPRLVDGLAALIKAIHPEVVVPSPVPVP